MNAVNPVYAPVVSTTVGGAEPSMEEILASIRRIIADDGAAPRTTDGVAREASAAAASPHEESSPLAGQDPRGPHDGELSQHPIVDPTADFPRHPLAPPPDVADLDPAPAGHAPIAASHSDPDVRPPPSLEPPPQAPAERASIARSEPVPASEPEQLLSAAANSSVTAAFNTLAASRFVDNSEQLMGLVRELIRPLVKTWVDEHLPSLVERAVVAEIERLARGGR